MGVLELAITTDNLRFEVDSLHNQLRHGPDDRQGLLRLCALYRQLGCAVLLGDLDVAEFQVALHKSARCYHWLLERPGGKVDAYYLCRSRGAPLLDALAAGRPDLARRISSLMKAPFAPRMEPEEDFRWFEILGDSLVPGTPRPDLLSAFAATLEGKFSARYDAAEAILAKDADGFAEALRTLSAEWPAEAERRRRSGGPYFAATEAHICVEAVALARLGAEHGLGVPRRLRFVPDEALGPVQAAFPESFGP